MEMMMIRVRTDTMKGPHIHKQMQKQPVPLKPTVGVETPLPVTNVEGRDIYHHVANFVNTTITPMKNEIHNFANKVGIGKSKTNQIDARITLKNNDANVTVTKITPNENETHHVPGVVSPSKPKQIDSKITLKHDEANLIHIKITSKEIETHNIHTAIEIRNTTDRQITPTENPMHDLFTVVA